MTYYQSWPPSATHASQSAGQSMSVQQADAFAGPQGPTAPQYGVGQSAERDVQVQSGQESTGQPPVAVPRVDVVESSSELVVYVDVPGFEKDQLEIHADANQLYLSGDRSEDAAVNVEGGERALVAERPLRIQRTIPLPVTIDAEQVTADHDNGVCEIVVPKDERDRRHEIGFQ